MLSDITSVAEHNHIHLLPSISLVFESCASRGIASDCGVRSNLETGRFEVRPDPLYAVPGGSAREWRFVCIVRTHRGSARRGLALRPLVGSARACRIVFVVRT